MNKIILKKSLENAQRDSKLCSDIVDATFELLSEMITLKQGLSIDGIGSMGAHERRGANQEIPNEKGEFAQKNLSIFFHPSTAVKERVRQLVEDVSED